MGFNTENPRESIIEDLIAGLQTDVAARGPVSIDALYDETGLPS